MRCSVTRIWFNHWFSTAYNIISMIKQADSSVAVIGSNENEFTPYRIVCDEWYREPVLGEDEYVDFCLSFCREHSIGIFMPRRNFLAISRRRQEFFDIGVKLMVDPYELIYPLNCKSEAYRLLSDCPEIEIPEHRIVTNAAQFAQAYDELKEHFDKICFKFEEDEGGKSFRLIDNSRKGYPALFKRQNTRMPYSDAFAAMSEAESFPKMIVMPYLPDDEVSVDCLNTASGLIMIPRIKGTTRTEQVVYPEDILNMCRAFHSRFPLDAPFNIQFKYLRGVPYFLEVNTRMSGGVQLACAASGVNIPYIAVSRLLGKELPWSIDKKEKYVTHVETPVIF